MIKKCNRQQKIANAIKREIATILQHRIKDPRIGMMTIVSNVRISYDLSYAKVYVTFLNERNKDIITNNIKILQKASGYIKYSLSKNINLRIIPEITFFYDYSFIEGMRISNLLAKVIRHKNFHETEQ